MADIALVQPQVCVLMENAFILAELLPQDCLVIGRPYSLMVGFTLLLNGPLAYEQGQEMAWKTHNTYGHIRRINAWMLGNEPTVKENLDAWCWGAFDAAASVVFAEQGKTYVGGNFAMGTPEPEVFAAYWQGYATYGGVPSSPVGYHGYSDGETASRWLERRPWELWLPELVKLGLPMPRIIFTEAGFDRGGGYRWYGIPSEMYADYLAQLPELCPQLLGACVFGYGMTDDWVQRGFDIRGDSVVLAGMAHAKKGREIPMADYNRDQVWQDYARRLSLVPAFEKYRAMHPELGDWTDGSEYDVKPYRFRGAAGGLVYAKLFYNDKGEVVGGDWANVRHATRFDELPLA